MPHLASLLFKSLISCRSTGSDPFTHVYTMSMGSGGQSLWREVEREGEGGGDEWGGRQRSHRLTHSLS